jgi:hypothetical protein
VEVEVLAVVEVHMVSAVHLPCTAEEEDIVAAVACMVDLGAEGICTLTLTESYSFANSL